MRKRNIRSKFRDFRMRDETTINKSYLKYFTLVMKDVVGNYDITEAQMRFLLFAYDYQFFTLDHMSEYYYYSKAKLGQRIIYPLSHNDYVFKYFDRLSPTSYQEAIFDEKKFNYRVRYAITQKARLLVQRFYRKLEGEEEINVPS
jgi:hypothetical protein